MFLAKYMAIWRACTRLRDFVCMRRIFQNKSVLHTVVMMSSMVGFAFAAVHDFAYDTLCQLQVDFLVVYGRMGHNGDDNAFQVAHAVTTFSAM